MCVQPSEPAVREFISPPSNFNHVYHLGSDKTRRDITVGCIAWAAQIKHSRASLYIYVVGGNLQYSLLICMLITSTFHAQINLAYVIRNVVGSSIYTVNNCFSAFVVRFSYQHFHSLMRKKGGGVTCSLQTFRPHV